MTQHVPEIRPYYPATYRYYTARCACGWQGSTHESRRAAEAAVSDHMTTTAHHSALVT